ncbi:hypothetical protein VP01_1383g4 [Puccinia sorghi]|uniref:Uncharacterized protein n=1 Tax=Puccinia sorghi TaxID=27349 RepID=A0A0L6VLB5_9BASI|nr:hypothetical protein VP01_1383g4 [Puccinia sorghi]
MDFVTLITCKLTLYFPSQIHSYFSSFWCKKFHHYLKILPQLILGVRHATPTLDLRPTGCCGTGPGGSRNQCSPGVVPKILKYFFFREMNFEVEFLTLKSVVRIFGIRPATPICVLKIGSATHLDQRRNILWVADPKWVGLSFSCLLIHELMKLFCVTVPRLTEPELTTDEYFVDPTTFASKFQMCAPMITISCFLKTKRKKKRNMNVTWQNLTVRAMRGTNDQVTCIQASYIDYIQVGRVWKRKTSQIWNLSVSRHQKTSYFHDGVKKGRGEKSEFQHDSHLVISPGICQMTREKGAECAIFKALRISNHKNTRKENLIRGISIA